MPPAFESKSEVDSYLGGEEIICLLCGGSFISIGHHVARSHSMSARDYKIKFGLPITKGISTEESKARWRQNIKKTRDSGRLAEQDAAFQKPRIAASLRPAAQAPRYVRADRRFDQKKIYDILVLIKSGATLNAACKQAGVPSRTWLFNLLKGRKELRLEWEKAWDSLPFPVQARCKNLGARFLATVEGLRSQGYTDAQISEKTGVSEETCRRARHRKSRATEKGGCLKCGKHIGRGIKAHIKSCAGKIDVEEIDLTQQPSKKVLLKRAQRFEQALLRLQKFVARTGSACASVLYVEPDGFKLGTWVSQQRTEYHAGRLSPDRIAALESLPGWMWRAEPVFTVKSPKNTHTQLPRPQKFEDRFFRLQEFVERTGSACISVLYVEPDGFRLGRWVSSRRSEYHTGRLSPDRIAALESLPGWTWRVRANPPKNQKKERV